MRGVKPTPVIVKLIIEKFMKQSIIKICIEITVRNRIVDPIILVNVQIGALELVQ